jgi:rsbT co-antagonist protein RsbR
MHTSEPLDAQSARNHRIDNGAIAQPDPALVERNIHVVRLRQFLRWLLVFVVAFALLQITGAIIRPSISGGASAIISSTHAVLLLVAWVQLARGRPVIAVILIGAGFAGVALFGAAGIPEALPVYILLPVLSAVVALPFLGRQALRSMTIIVTLAAGIITTLALTVRTFPAPTLQKVMLIIAVTGISGLTMFLLEQLHRRLAETLAQTRTVNTMLEQARVGLEAEVATRTHDLRTALDELAQRAEEQAALLAEIRQQRDAIRELSVPVLPLQRGTLVMPLIGALDSTRLRDLQERALQAIQRVAARRLLLDITGVVIVDTQVAQGLIGVVQAARLLGTEVVLVGIRPEVAQTIVELGLDLSAVRTYSDIQTALDSVERPGDRRAATTH